MYTVLVRIYVTLKREKAEANTCNKADTYANHFTRHTLQCTLLELCTRASIET